MRSHEKALVQCRSSDSYAVLREAELLGHVDRVWTLQASLGRLVTGSRDVLRHIDPAAVTPDDDWPADAMGPREARVLDAVPVRRPVPLARIARTAGLVESDVLAALGVLEAEGLIERMEAGWRRGSRASAGPPRTMGG